ncbi:MAG: mitochondrial fission ELM1 family protein [Methylococcaceae bacterium]|nr:mitochondrial fission ELM1 family protein [Methylococcaceae bacterium]
MKEATAESYNEKHPLVWVVNSAYTGELHARIGVAERLGFGFEIIPLPNGNDHVYRQTLKKKYQEKVNGHEPPLMVISGTGEETTAEIADLRQEFEDRLFNIYLASILPDDRHPRLNEYDLIASPQLEGDKIVTLTGVPHQMTQEKLALSRQHHSAYFKALPRPIIGLLIGGNTRYCDGFDEHHAQRLAQRISKIATALNACIVITNSRRTPSDALSALLQGLEGHQCDFFDWQTVESTFYPALLANADLFIVTGDSLSMCSEAAFTGKPLLVDLCQRATESYHRDIVGRLIDYGAAKVLGGFYEPWTYTPPDPTEQVVKEIRAWVEGAVK